MPLFEKITYLGLLVIILTTAPIGIRAEVPPVATFSIVATDPETGEIGIAVQSKIVSVGSIVPFARAGAGAVVTQSYANVKYGPFGLYLLEEDHTPDSVLSMLTQADPQRDYRQAGIIDHKGNASSFTGKECTAWAGSVVGKHFAAQGNMLTGPEVVEAMAKAFQETKGVLAERLLASLEAGQKSGGDKRGRQSAALIIVREGWGYGGLNDRFRDVRVDEHETPIKELRRVYQAHRNLFPRP
jgi:uncharacterized Ntn-hydrolase superfamily protein